MTITCTRMLIDDGATLRIKFDILQDARHFGFVRFFALLSDNVIQAKPRVEMARILKDEHTAAWRRYHART